MKLIHYFNLRTFLALVISQIAAYLAITFQIKFSFNILLFGIAVVFPLHFSIQAAFKRRDKALEFFSLFKGGAMALHYSFQVSEDLSTEGKQEARGLLKKMTDQLFNQLENQLKGYRTFQQFLDNIFIFIEKNKEGISSRNKLRMIRYMRDTVESSTYLLSLVNHRTMAGMRFYGIFFTLIFPMVQAPIMLNNMESLVPAWGFYILMAITSLIIVTLSNFQSMIEYPFDQRGMDNIQVQDFKLDI
jgi:small-conductance mechanosensitive channel